jgi:hypothetical protein
MCVTGQHRGRRGGREGRLTGSANRAPFFRSRSLTYAIASARYRRRSPADIPEPDGTAAPAALTDLAGATAAVGAFFDDEAAALAAIELAR